MCKKRLFTRNLHHNCERHPRTIFTPCLDEIQGFVLRIFPEFAFFFDGWVVEVIYLPWTVVLLGETKYDISLNVFFEFTEFLGEAG